MTQATRALYPTQSTFSKRSTTASGQAVKKASSEYSLIADVLSVLCSSRENSQQWSCFFFFMIIFFFASLA